ncbi:hypothetical protein CCAX7_20200 [Capsulimonas corticalis]|uniref:Uncharacterized protein n=1 Tax=Capsulimonas corticalis TaxID=2219043 RepID=A0A402D2K7_9BACT|nr:hypothetical protein [Capsulimonas corticalis]BDI29969.1 hypothetical protein CCAX7_20200 [Capsulimonas corticalis]
MNEYVLLVRVDRSALAPEQVQAIQSGWGPVLEKWVARGQYVTSNLIVGDGYVLSGPDRETTQGVVSGNGGAVVSTITLLAETIEEAIELAKVCPPLNFGGSVEVRLRQPPVVIPGN